MKNIFVKRCEKQLRVADIAELEQELQMILPEGYKQFLLKFNGGKPDKDTFDFLNSWGGSIVDDFYAYYDGDDCINLLREFSRNKDILPEEFIAIARDPGGNKICLGVSPEIFGKVYLFVQTWEVDENNEPLPDCMHTVSNSFADFINGLYKILDVRNDSMGVKTWIYEHDSYSLPFSMYVAKYGLIVTDFFARASSDIESYIIEEKEEGKVIAILRYDELSSDTRFCRKINADGSFEDYQEQLAG